MDSRAPRADSLSRARAAPGRGATLRELRRHGAARAENMLVHGDNLEVLRLLANDFAGRVRCAYLDPPFNTGRTFAEYKDSLDEAGWAAMMRPRLEALAPLLAHDGAVFVEIDDTQLGALNALMDAVFGAKNRISTITVVRSATTGHKAQNRGPVHVSDFVLAYAREKKAWTYRPQVRVRAGLDPAYGTWLDDPDAPPAKWTFRPLKKAAREAGIDDSKLTAFALAHAKHVVRFAQPRYEAIAKEAQRIVDQSRARPEAVFVHERPGRPPFIVRGGNRILFLSAKVRTVDGRRAIVEPLTNVWDDVPFQGIAREGGVVFSRNKKPERLVARVVAMASDPGDWVLDPFLGSGTTAAAAHKMGRRWIGIESGAHAETLAEPRLARVVAGSDATGVTKATQWKGGGGFRVYGIA